MEATPSLACANKCVFCWRHHKNPVGTEWRWKEDDPSFIVEEAISLHRGMINEMKGIRTSHVHHYLVVVVVVVVVVVILFSLAFCFARSARRTPHSSPGGIHRQVDANATLYSSMVQTT